MGINLLESLSDNISVDTDTCTFCGICVDTCILDNLRMKLAPCRAACPMGVNCQGYVRLIARGEEAAALELMRRDLPFPGILGRVCSQPCEARCHHRVVDGEAVAIRALKRYLADHPAAADTPLPDPAPDRGTRVAVVGSGPAGVMAAWELRSKGHGVTVFERESEPGGMLRWAVPEFRLPAAVLARELGPLTAMGVEIRCGVTVGRDISFRSLEEEFGAVIVATGCPKPRRLDLPGRDARGTVDGLTFLREVRAGSRTGTVGAVVVIGGGNVAVDAAQTALRLGADTVTLVCLESRREMPAFPWEIETAEAEGVLLRCGWGPTGFDHEGGAVTGVGFRRCTRVFDSAGAFAPEFSDDRPLRLEAGTVIVAVGQEPDRDLPALAGLCDVGGTPEVDPLTLRSINPRVFVAGDVAAGPSSVVEAMAAGRRAAESVHRLLTGAHLTYGRSYRGPVETDFDIDTSPGVPVPRVALPQHTGLSARDFEEVERCLDTASARKEASRCYSCGQPFGKYRTCWFCLPCEVECPHDALWVEIPYLAR